MAGPYPQMPEPPIVPPPKDSRFRPVTRRIGSALRDNDPRSRARSQSSDRLRDFELVGAGTWSRVVEFSYSFFAINVDGEIIGAS